MAWDMQSWWPLVTGFAVAWGLRMLGGDPGYRSGSLREYQLGGASESAVTAASPGGYRAFPAGNVPAFVAQQVGAQQASAVAPRGRTLRTLGTIVGALLGVVAGFGVPAFGPRWETYNAPEAGFSVECPGALQSRVDPRPPVGRWGEARPRLRGYVLQGVRQWRGLFRGSRAVELLSTPTYQVLVMDLPATVVGGPSDRVAASLLDAMFLGGAKKDRTLLSDGSPAYRATTTQDGKRLAIQVSADSKHAYVLSALNAHDADAIRFFDSLRLLSR